MPASVRVFVLVLARETEPEPAMTPANVPAAVCEMLKLRPDWTLMVTVLLVGDEIVPLSEPMFVSVPADKFRTTAVPAVVVFELFTATAPVPRAVAALMVTVPALIVVPPE